MNGARRWNRTRETAAVVLDKKANLNGSLVPMGQRLSAKINPYVTGKPRA